MSEGNITGDGEFSTVSWGGYQWGIALPQDAATVDTFDYIGMIVGSTPNGTGWSGVVHGNNAGAAMSNHLMLLAWPYNGEILTSFRYSLAYADPVPYNGSATITQLHTEINATNWKLVYHCQNCYLFDQPGQTSSNMSTSVGHFENGWAQSYIPVSDPSDPSSPIVQHNNGMGEFSVAIASATQASYSNWATLTATHTNTATATAAASTTTVSSQTIPTGVTYDYIVVGGGAGGIPMADKLSEAGHSVLLIEKGPASSARWGGTLRPESGWLDGTNLTWIDVPGLCNRIWQSGGSNGVACADTDQMAGCVLGGGTAVNAGLWWNPNPADWDVNFPAGWQAADMANASARVMSRIPGTDHPSLDGKLYMQEGFDVVSTGLGNAGWSNVTANNVPDQKNRTYAHTPYMYSHGERGGPMATYLVSANGRTNFHMWLNTSVKRVVRDNGHATGLEVEAFNNGGYAGVVNVTSTTGRVILSAGTFGTAKILFRSGIGPTDQLNVVNQSTDGPTMIDSTYWITLPVGENLDDHLNTNLVISHPSVKYYDWLAAWDTPNTTDSTNYLNSRTGPFAQAAPNIGPMFWEEIECSDGITRQLQYTARVEGSEGEASGTTMTLSQYLGRGATSRGRTTIGLGLNMVVSTLPWLQNDGDTEAVVKSIEHVISALNTVQNLTFLQPASNVSAADYVANMPLTYANIGDRRSNHWLGTAKIGTDDGRTGGTAVVDLNTKVYGTDNLFVVDASIFPGMPSTNPSALIVAVAEHASERILALSANEAVAQYGRCGGLNWTGSMACTGKRRLPFARSWSQY
ncbi:cellobiose dehydrogenase protein [Coleophoma crateriformis]|uniref:Cellobiose dehydrogenase protein n=1 Tax=Coleophoma crateriformis TaxID=565419 RepID=A0A3D8RIX2_9HELO|nr:cellobiose dehydrogenase protein [Coleophoma crateriformis]